VLQSHAAEWLSCKGRLKDANVVGKVSGCFSNPEDAARMGVEALHSLDSYCMLAGQGRGQRG
jgi:hypothetical protein